MLGSKHIKETQEHFVTYLPGKKEKLSNDEWNEMTALKNAMNHDITQVVPEKMEAFTEYFVRSLREKGG